MANIENIGDIKSLYEKTLYWNNSVGVDEVLADQFEDRMHADRDEYPLESSDAQRLDDPEVMSYRIWFEAGVPDSG